MEVLLMERKRDNEKISVNAGDHLRIIGPTDERGLTPAELMRQDGSCCRVSIEARTPGASASGQNKLMEPCDRSSDGDVFHVVSRGGPPMVNTKAFCDNWVRIFGSPDEQTGATPSDLAN